VYSFNVGAAVGSRVSVGDIVGERDAGLSVVGTAEGDTEGDRVG